MGSNMAENHPVGFQWVMEARRRGARIIPAARRPRLGAAAMVAGAVTTRWAAYRAGFQSARDPRYVVEPQRARLAESRG
jgi:anaerobic selenocysteine-containing dehydrogenase